MRHWKAWRRADVTTTYGVESSGGNRIQRKEFNAQSAMPREVRIKDEERKSRKKEIKKKKKDGGKETCSILRACFSFTSLSRGSYFSFYITVFIIMFVLFFQTEEKYCLQYDVALCGIASLSPLEISCERTSYFSSFHSMREKREGEKKNCSCSRKAQ